jgi:hypothetical protein
LHIFVGILGLLLLLGILRDSFETVILPRYVNRKFKLSRTWFRSTWRFWRAVARRIDTDKRRESYLGYFGPLSFLLLLAMWASMMILAFAMLYWASRASLNPGGFVPPFRTYLYMSGTTFFTLGLGDVVPGNALGRVIAVGEAGTGFGFLAVVIAFLPTVYTAFSEREVNISLLDARAGSPPTAGELLRRHGHEHAHDVLTQFVHDWEIWSAQLMESHISYPFLCFFRSQHDNQSWVAAFTAMLDVSALLVAYGEGEAKWQAQLTFAISRHAVSDIAEILRVKPQPLVPDRLPPEDLTKVRALLIESGAGNGNDNNGLDKLGLKLLELRQLYEPQLQGLSKLLMMPLPTWGADPKPVVKGRPTVWSRITSAKADPQARAEDQVRHF